MITESKNILAWVYSDVYLFLGATYSHHYQNIIQKKRVKRKVRKKMKKKKNKRENQKET